MTLPTLVTAAPAHAAAPTPPASAGSVDWEALLTPSGVWYVVPAA